MKTKIKATARSHCGPVRKADKAALGGGRGGGGDGGGARSEFSYVVTHTPTPRRGHSTPVRPGKETPMSTQMPLHYADISSSCNSPNVGTTAMSTNRWRGPSPLCPHHGTAPRVPRRETNGPWTDVATEKNQNDRPERKKPRKEQHFTIASASNSRM